MMRQFHPVLDRCSHGSAFAGRRFRLAIALFVVMLGSSGCRQGHFNAASLPPEYAAPRLAGVGSLNLSRLYVGSGSDKSICPGDVLEVTIATGAVEENPQRWLLRVAQDGTIAVPLVGAVGVAGLDLFQAEYEICTAGVQRKIFRQPSVAVRIKDRNANRVIVTGAVGKPGTYELPVAGSDLLTALLEAGGLSEDADSIVEIRRFPRRESARIVPASAPISRQQDFSGTSPRANEVQSIAVTSLDLASPAANGGADYYLDDATIVTVMKRPKRVVGVIGLVQNPGKFELPKDQDARLLDAIALAGGKSLSAADKVNVIRHLPGSDKTVVINASIRKAKQDGDENIRLAAGDVVSVEETPATFVTGTLRQFINVGVGVTGSIPLF